MGEYLFARRPFQFQYGAIWRLLAAGTEIDVYLFQFQYGAIWSLKRWKHKLRSPTFQFQYGAIWSDAEYTLIDTLTCFNSSMVRFGAAFILLLLI